uniref:Putative secreted protein n=1 Tax=Anopheles darlingi TaxID=43151 RepID=A0A2M4DB64_ANODA
MRGVKRNHLLPILFTLATISGNRHSIWAFPYPHSVQVPLFVLVPRLESSLRVSVSHRPLQAAVYRNRDLRCWCQQLYHLRMHWSSLPALFSSVAVPRWQR